MVAAVAAIDEESAYRALALIDVQYEKLPGVMTIDRTRGASQWWIGRRCRSTVFRLRKARSTRARPL
jgi:CO/xanthine dehydrogenase Mo-binding subunit